jgi:predicted amidohydrolase
MEDSMDGTTTLVGQAGAKAEHDKRAKFVELAESRTINAIRAIRVIGKLGNKSAYEYDDADVKKIISALSKEVDALRARLGQKSNKGEVEFKL